MGISVLVVDDSALMRKRVAEMVQKIPGVIQVQVARNGEEGYQMVLQGSPDVVTMDVEMPVRDGLSAVQKIMAEKPTPIIMLSSLTQTGSDIAVKALAMGAVDVIAKPSGAISLDIDRVEQELRQKIMAATRVKLRHMPLTRPVSQPRSLSSLLQRYILIGSSTGGPRAIQQILPALPISKLTTYVLIQHMPIGFTESWVRTLRLSRPEVSIKIAEEQEKPAGQTIYIARAGSHLAIDHGLFTLINTPPVHGVRPAVDVTFQSFAESFGNKVVGVVLTGMGVDGALGAGLIRKKGGKVIVESEETATIFGMPKAVIATGQADQVLPLTDIPAYLAEVL